MKQVALLYQHELEALTKEINNEIEAGDVCFEQGERHYRKAGALAIKLKASLPHGHFGSYVRDHIFDCKIRQLNRYMQLARDETETKTLKSITYGEAMVEEPFPVISNQSFKTDLIKPETPPYAEIQEDLSAKIAKYEQRIPKTPFEHHLGIMKVASKIHELIDYLSANTTEDRMDLKIEDAGILLKEVREVIIFLQNYERELEDRLNTIEGES